MDDSQEQVTRDGILITRKIKELNFECQTNETIDFLIENQEIDNIRVVGTHRI